MASVFAKKVFTQNTLTTLDSKNSFTCYLRSENGDRFSPDLLRNQSEGFVLGYLTNPQYKPDWLIPGIILKGKINNGNIEYIFTVEPTVNLGIEKARKKIGDEIRLSWILATEYDNKNV